MGSQKFSLTMGTLRLFEYIIYVLIYNLCYKNHVASVTVALHHRQMHLHKRWYRHPVVSVNKYLCLPEWTQHLERYIFCRHLLHVSAVFDHHQINLTTFFVYVVWSTWCWPKMAETCSRWHGMCSILHVLFVLDSKHRQCFHYIKYDYIFYPHVCTVHQWNQNIIYCSNWCTLL